MLDGLIVPVFQALYNLLHAVAGIFWWINQAILVVGYYVMSLTDWLVNTALSPLIDSVSHQTLGLLAPIFVIAMIVLGITYLLAVFGHIQIVSFRSAVLWLLLAAFVYQVGPQLYQGTEQMRRGLGGLFYEEGIHALSGGAGDITALDAIGTSAEATMDVPTNQYGMWIPSDTAVDGLDVAMAYLYADGCDVIRASGCMVMGTLPSRWYLPGGPDPDYFANTASAVFFPSMNNDERQESLQKAVDGIWRLASGIIIAFFGLVEQVIHLALALAMGVAYVSLLVGVLFAFFKRTEPITWSVFNLVLELFIQSIITSLLLSIVISFVIIGAMTANAVVLFGTSFIGLILVIVLLIGALKALLGATNRLMGSLSQATGGNLAADGQITSVAGAAVGGGTALLRGASLGQAAGVALSGTRAAQAAYYAASAFGPDTGIGSLASQVFEGAAVGRVFSPVAAGFLLPRTSGRDEDSNGEETIAPMDENGNPMPPYRRRRRSSSYGAVGTPISGHDTYDGTEDSGDFEEAFAAYYSLLAAQQREQRDRQTAVPVTVQTNAGEMMGADEVGSLASLHHLLREETPAADTASVAESSHQPPSGQSTPVVTPAPASLPDHSAAAAPESGQSDDLTTIERLSQEPEIKAQGWIDTAQEQISSPSAPMQEPLSATRPVQPEPVSSTTSAPIVPSSRAESPDQQPVPEIPPVMPQPAPVTPTPPVTPTSTDDLVTKVDASDDDDFGRLSGALAAARPDLSSLAAAIAAVLAAGRPGTLPTVDQAADSVAYTADMTAAQQPEVGEFVRLAAGLRLPPEQAGAVAQQALDTGGIGPQLAASLRAHLSSLPVGGGSGSLGQGNIDRAVQALERAAGRMAAAVGDNPEHTASLDVQVTAGKLPAGKLPAAPGQGGSDGG